MAIAGAVDQLGDEAASVSADLQRARNATIAADLDIKMREAQQSFIESTIGDPNEKEWVPRSQEMADNVINEAFSEKEAIPPGLRNQMRIGLNDWKEKLTIHARILENDQTVRRAEATLDRDYQAAVRDLDADGALKAINLAKESKVNPIKIEQWKTELPHDLALTAVENGMTENAKKTTDILKSNVPLPVNGPDGNPIKPRTAFNADELKRLIEHGNAQTSVQQRQHQQDLLLSYWQDQSAPKSDKELNDMVKEGVITETGAMSYRNTVKQANLESSKANAARLTMKIDDVDWVGDKNRDATALHFQNEISAIPNDGLQKELSEHLTAKLNAGKKGATKEDSDAPGKEYIAAVLRTGALGTDDPKVKKGGPYLATMERVFHLQTELKAFMKENPKATPDEQVKFIEGRIQVTKDVSIFGNTDWLKAKSANTDGSSGAPYIDGTLGVDGIAPDKKQDVGKWEGKLYIAPKGTRKRQAGVVYESDGKGTWNVVK